MVTSERFTLPGLTLHALVAGHPAHPKVVLLHGFPESCEAFRALLPRFAAAGLRAIAPDLRGYGQSDGPSGGYDLDTLAGDVAALIDVLGGRAHLVAQDWGGVIAHHLAAHHPERVDRLVIINAPHPAVMAKRVTDPRQLWRSWYVLFFQLPGLPDFLLSRKGGALVRQLLHGLLRSPPRGDASAIDRFAEDFARPGAAGRALAYYRAVPMRRGPRYPKIAAPFRLIWGERDTALSAILTRNLEPYFEHPPDVRLLPGIGHFLWLEDPDAFVRLTLEHLQG